MLLTKTVKKTNSGLFIRFDYNFGFTIYSPYTGLIYGVEENSGNRILDWLDKQSHEIPKDIYMKTLGIGWSKSIMNPEYIIPHLLPSKFSFYNIKYPNQPLVINWFLTGKCSHNCIYCDAADLMHNDILEPDFDTIINISNNILYHEPLVVVLTGGDPLISPFIFNAIEILSEKTGIIVDTNGYLLNHEHLDIFKRNRVVVRISLDSLNPKVHCFQRPLNSELYNGNSYYYAIKALKSCLKENIPVIVQTVATIKNLDNLLAMGDKLVDLNVPGWRILKIQPSVKKLNGYKKLIGDHGFDRYHHVFKKLYKRHQSYWKKYMSLQISINDLKDLNSVVLVSQNGKFYTESTSIEGKLLLDENNPKRPSLEAISNKLNYSSHYSRYLNNWIR